MEKPGVTNYCIFYLIIIIYNRQKKTSAKLCKVGTMPELQMKR